MKNLLIIAIAFLALSCNKSDLETFKKEHPDAPNKVVQPIENFKRFRYFEWSQQDNKDIVVTVGYYSIAYKEYIAYGIFKINGKQIYFESGQ